jgi:hypothetical protein
MYYRILILVILNKGRSYSLAQNTAEISVQKCIPILTFYSKERNALAFDVFKSLLYCRLPCHYSVKQFTVRNLLRRDTVE